MAMIPGGEKTVEKTDWFKGKSTEFTMVFAHIFLGGNVSSFIRLDP